MSAYMLTLAVFIPVSGWIADRFASRTVFGSAGDLHGSVGSVRVFRGYRIVHGGARSAGNRRRHDGAGRAQFTTLGTLAYADVTDAQKGPASTLWSVAQQMTIGMGIAFGALALYSVIGYARLARGAGSAIGGGAG